MILADSHIHLFAGGFPGRYGALFPKGGELTTYESIRSVHQIERALVVGYEGEPWAKGNNAYLAKLAQNHGWIAPTAFCHATKPPSAAALKGLWEKRFCGISIYLAAAAEVEAVLNWPHETFAELNSRRAVISINVPVENIESLRPFFLRLSQTRILLSHMGLPGRIEVKSSVGVTRKLLAPITNQADLPHLGVKISAFYGCSDYPHTGIKPVLDTLQNSFTEKRLYWGSDFSPALDDVTFVQTIEAAKSYFGDGAAAKAVFHKNLVKVIDRVR